MPLIDIRIVLIRPTHPGNVGAVARAIKNMQLESLYLVSPEDFPSPEATARAAGAGDVLERAVVCDSLDEAIKGCHLVIGTTARMRRIEWPELDTVECARTLLTGSRQGPVALLFGQERMGLTNPELDRCQYVVTIPSNPEHPVLNLACAVQILAYEIYRAELAGRVADDQQEREAEPVGSEDMRLFYQHLEEVLHQTGFLDPDNPRFLMRRLMRLYNRAQLDRNELNILRGILTSIQKPRPRV
jgi:tRNA (cytidine32/uridine32-2'-O)-methyltransferase